jgi:hypothetical protein
VDDRQHSVSIQKFFPVQLDRGPARLDTDDAVYTARRYDPYLRFTNRTSTANSSYLVRE